MKLSSDEIGAIEALLNLRAMGVRNGEIAQRLETSPAVISLGFSALAALGVAVPAAKTGRPMGSKSARPKRQAVRKRAAARQPRKFLTAEEWEQRLSAIAA